MMLKVAVCVNACCFGYPDGTTPDCLEVDTSKPAAVPILFFRERLQIILKMHIVYAHGNKHR